MARINIEESLWADARFIRLCVLMGDELRAAGAVVMAWRLAQTYWCPEKKKIPHEVVEKSSLPKELITVGLVRDDDDGFYVCGSEGHFAWWFERVEAGRRGGLAKARNASKAKQSCSKTKQSSSKLWQNVPSSSFSSSKKEEIHMSADADQRAADFDLAEVWNSNCGNLPKATKPTKTRLVAMRARKSEHPDRDYWVEVAKRIAASEFCRGEKPGSTWRANFDWFLKPDTHVKVLEGRYSPPGPVAPPQQDIKPMEFNPVVRGAK